MEYSRQGSDSGSATVEFLAVTVLLLIPIVYLLITFADVQAATYAAESAARETGRIFARAESEHRAHEQSMRATALAFSDHGIVVTPAQIMEVTCETVPCLTPGAGIHIRVSLEVPLPLLPEFFAHRLATSVTVTADSFATVDRFGG